MTFIILVLVLGAARSILTSTQSNRSCHYRTDTVYGGVLWDCRSKGLNHIPKGLGRNTTTIDLRGNSITAASNYSLVDVPFLKCLLLDENNIDKLEDNAFYGLGSLEILSLTNNNLQLNHDCYPQAVFSNLEKLKELRIEGNSKGSEGIYPDDVFVYLKSLEVLVIDAFDKIVFGPAFRNITSLRTLQLKGTGIHSMNGESFINVPFLHTLDLTDCPVFSIADATFKPLLNLTSLILKNTKHLTLESAIHALKVLKGRRMKLIDLTAVYFQEIPNANLSNRILTKNALRPLTNICVDSISLANNMQINIDLSTVLDTVPTVLATCLNHLDISFNTLMGENPFDIHFQNFTSLISMNISSQHRWAGVKNLKFTTFENTSGTEEETGVDKLQSRSKCPYILHIYLPPLIKVLDISRGVSLSNVLSKACLMFHNAHNMEVLYASYIEMNNIRNYIIGLNHTKKLDLSGNDLANVIPSFFEEFHLVTYLKLCNVNLKMNTMEHIKEMFSKLRNLKLVQLSSNQLKGLPDKLFHDSYNLSTVILNQNLFQNIPDFIKHLSELTVLDMSNNIVSYIPYNTRDLFDNLNRKHRLTLKFRGNNFLCGCETLDFMSWLGTTLVELENDEDYVCVTDKGTHSNVSYVTRNYKMVWRQCIGKSLFYGSLCTLVIFLFIIIITWMIVVNKTKLKHFIVTLVYGHAINESTRQEYAFDAYIGHCENDWEFVCGELRQMLEVNIGLKLFLRDRDSHVSLPIADEIIRGIYTSWTTVLVLFPDFTEDLWMPFIIERAIFETRYTPRRLVLMLMGDVDITSLPYSLLDIVPEENIVEMSDISSEDAFTSLRGIITGQK